MKLNTLLLASAATLIASSAFAADLPSKKAAPAAGSVQVCKVGGMTGFTLPGSDTCLQISGRVTVDFANSNLDTDYFNEDGDVLGDGGYNYRLNFDARSNSEVGVVRSFLSLTGDTEARKAFVQIGGFTAGLKDSIADIAGTQGNQFGSFWSQSGVGVDYITSVGGLTFGIGAEDANTDGSISDRPDIILHLAGKAGDVGFKVAAVSQDNDGQSGYALLGHIDAKLGPASIYAFAGTSDNANCYISGGVHGGSCFEDDGEATSFGGGLTFNVASATSITIEGVSGEANGVEYSSIGLFASHALAKNLLIQPEVVMTEAHGGFDNTAAYLRIQRDF